MFVPTYNNNNTNRLVFLERLRGGVVIKLKRDYYRLITGIAAATNRFF